MGPASENLHNNGSRHAPSITLQRSRRADLSQDRSRPEVRSESKRASQVVRSPYLIRSSAARLPEVSKSRVNPTIRKCRGGRSLALQIACEMTQPREAVFFTL